MLMEVSTGDAVDEKGFETAQSPYAIDETAFPLGAPLEEQFAFLAGMAPDPAWLAAPPRIPQPGSPPSQVPYRRPATKAASPG